MRRDASGFRQFDPGAELPQGNAGAKSCDGLPRLSASGRGPTSRGHGLVPSSSSAVPSNAPKTHCKSNALIVLSPRRRGMHRVLDGRGRGNRHAGQTPMRKQLCAIGLSEPALQHHPAKFGSRPQALPQTAFRHPLASADATAELRHLAARDHGLAPASAAATSPGSTTFFFAEPPASFLAERRRLGQSAGRTRLLRQRP